MTTDNPSEFAKQLNMEYLKARRSRSVDLQRLENLPVRCYGSGDFIPQHMEFLKDLKFKFFVISKNLTMSALVEHIKPLVALPNLTNLLLSLDSENLENFENIKPYLSDKKIKLCFTGLSTDFYATKIQEKIDVFFNIGKRKRSEQVQAQKIKVGCPVDSGKLALKKACTKCSRCWASSATKQPNWNELWTT